MKQNRLGVCSSGDCGLKNPICLVALRADRFEKTVDHEVVLQRHAQFAGGEVRSELTIDKDCPATAPANADEPQWIADRLRIGSASYVSNLLSGVDSKA